MVWLGLPIGGQLNVEVLEDVDNCPAGVGDEILVRGVIRYEVSVSSLRGLAHSILSSCTSVTPCSRSIVVKGPDR